MMSKSQFKFVLALLIVSVPASAATFNVVLVGDPNVHITGQVDTSTDTFNITSWTSGPGGIASVPSPLPILLEARTAANTAFNIPDNWDGTVGSAAGFGFFLPPGQDTTQLTWTPTQPDSFWQGSSFGWGGLRNRLNVIVLASTNDFNYVPDASSPLAMIDLTVTPQVTAAAVPVPSSIWGGAMLVGLIAAQRLRRRSMGNFH